MRKMKKLTCLILGSLLVLQGTAALSAEESAPVGVTDEMIAGVAGADLVGAVPYAGTDLVGATPYEDLTDIAGVTSAGLVDAIPYDEGVVSTQDTIPPAEQTVPPADPTANLPVNPNTGRKYLDITPNFIQGNIRADVGGVGRIQVAPIQGIAVTGGTFHYEYFNPTDYTKILALDENGNWSAVGAGTLQVGLRYEYSQETLRNIVARFPDCDLVSKDVTPVLTFEITERRPVEDSVLDITPQFVFVPTGNVLPGDSGKIEVLPIYGVSAIGGTFEIGNYDPSVVQFNADGTWVAIAPGTVNATLNYHYTQDTLRGIAQQYPGRGLAVQTVAAYVDLVVIDSSPSPVSNMSGLAHVESYGWMSEVHLGEVMGTTGASKRLEALSLKLLKPAGEVEGSIEYRSYIQNQGWEASWRKDGEVSGTTGRALRIEAVQIRLTGAMADKYNVNYSAHVQGYGWLPATQNGEVIGTFGQSRRLEALMITLSMK